MTREEQHKIRLAIFASGSGSNAEAIMEHFRNQPKVEVSLIVTNNDNAGVIERAKRYNIEYLVVGNELLNKPEHSLDPIVGRKIDWIILAGWLRLIPTFLIEAFSSRIVNIHPALLPKYGGKGMYGRHVHKAVYENRENESGITIHYVNAQFDEGEIIAQLKTSIDQSDTPESIEQKVRALEIEHYSAEIEKLVLST